MEAYQSELLIIVVFLLGHTCIFAASNSNNMLSNTTTEDRPPTTRSPEMHPDCSSRPNTTCSSLETKCLQEISGCHHECHYGDIIDVEVTVLPSVPCIGDRRHKRKAYCSYCYQLPESDYDCSSKIDCKSTQNDASRIYRANCTVKSNILCFGKRTFYKNRSCSWKNGYSWTTAMLLSVTLGGFGVDRFYLGHWKEALGKLFSFGGLGVWTIIDVVLIAIGYVGPSDGSLYTYHTEFSRTYNSTRLYPFS